MNTKKILKIIGIIILIIIALVLIHTIRNYIIIKNMQKNFSKYEASTNYYIKSVATDESGAVATMEYYQKSNKQVATIEKNTNGEISKTTMYNNGERTDIFYDNKEGKTAKIDSKTIIDVQINNFLKSDSEWQTFLVSIPAKIKSTKYNEKDCYSIKNLPSAFYVAGESSEVYIEKETGLLVKNMQNDITTEKEYKFDCVEDTIFAEPDISQYTIKGE